MEDFSANPFIVLSYVSGPALLTNATSLLLLSTTNRFGRSVDRSRVLAEKLLDPVARAATPSLARQMQVVRRRLTLMARAMFGLYLSAATFALATLASIIGAAMAELGLHTMTLAVVGLAVAAGFAGFLALVAAAASMVAESRLAMRNIELEASDVLPEVSGP